MRTTGSSRPAILSLVGFFRPLYTPGVEVHALPLERLLPRAVGVWLDFASGLARLNWAPQKRTPTRNTMIAMHGQVARNGSRWPFAASGDPNHIGNATSQSALNRGARTASGRKTSTK